MPAQRLSDIELGKSVETSWQGLQEALLSGDILSIEGARVGLYNTIQFAIACGLAIPKEVANMIIGPPTKH